MEKKYIVRLTDEEREALHRVIKKLKGSSQKVRRAQILLKADADGPNWTDKKIAEAFSCRTKTVENIRQRLVTEGFRDHARREGTRDTAAAKNCSTANRKRRSLRCVWDSRRRALRTGRCGCWPASGGAWNRRHDQP